MKCPNRDCKQWKRCTIIDTPDKFEYAKRTRFICKDCGEVACFYCGDPSHHLCDGCKEARLE